MLTADGEIYACGTFRDANGSIGLTEAGPEKSVVHLPCDRRVVKIVSGGDHVLALTEEGLIYSVGESIGFPSLSPSKKEHFQQYLVFITSVLPYSMSM